MSGTRGGVRTLQTKTVLASLCCPVCRPGPPTSPMRSSEKHIGPLSSMRTSSVLHTIICFRSFSALQGDRHRGTGAVGIGRGGRTSAGRRGSPA